MTMETKIHRLAGAVDLPLLVSPSIPAGFAHGFTTRAGGASQPPFATLNLGWKWGDDRAAVDENHRRLLLASSVRTMFRASQVHGVGILRVRGGDDPRSVAIREADGLCSDEPGLGLSVHVADCTPILLACSRTGACAALHAGWRGTVAGVVRAGVDSLAFHFGCRPWHLNAALGPCIGACCFEVGPEVVDAFVAALPAARENGVVLATGEAKPHIDLRRFQRLQLEAAGLLPENIDASSECTHCDPSGRFYSFRRSGRSTGQLAGFISRLPT